MSSTPLHETFITHLPITHATHAVEAAEPVAALYVPAAHATHAVDTVDVVAVLYLPATHEVQELCPVED